MRRGSRSGRERGKRERPIKASEAPATASQLSQQCSRQAEGLSMRPPVTPPQQHMPEAQLLHAQYYLPQPHAPPQVQQPQRRGSVPRAQAPHFHPAAVLPAQRAVPPVVPLGTFQDEVVVPFELREYCHSSRCLADLRGAVHPCGARAELRVDRMRVLVHSENEQSLRRACIVLEAQLEQQVGLEKRLAIKARLQADLAKVQMELDQGLRCEFHVAPEVLGHVIGPKGAHVRQVQEESNVDRVVIDREKCVVRVMGPTRESVQQAREQLELVRVDFSVAPEHLPIVIGKAGKSIQSVKARSGCKVVEVVGGKQTGQQRGDAAHGDDCFVKLIGTSWQAHNAQLLLSALVAHTTKLADEHNQLTELRRKVEQLDLEWGMDNTFSNQSSRFGSDARAFPGATRTQPDNAPLSAPSQAQQQGRAEAPSGNVARPSSNGEHAARGNNTMRNRDPMRPTKDAAAPAATAHDASMIEQVKNTRNDVKNRLQITKENVGQTTPTNMRAISQPSQNGGKDAARIVKEGQRQPTVVSNGRDGVRSSSMEGVKRKSESSKDTTKERDAGRFTPEDAPVGQGTQHTPNASQTPSDREQDRPKIASQKDEAPHDPSKTLAQKALQKAMSKKQKKKTPSATEEASPSKEERGKDDSAASQVPRLHENSDGVNGQRIGGTRLKAVDASQQVAGKVISQSRKPKSKSKGGGDVEKQGRHSQATNTKSVAVEQREGKPSLQGKGAKNAKVPEVSATISGAIRTGPAGSKHSATDSVPQNGQPERASQPPSEASGRMRTDGERRTDVRATTAGANGGEPGKPTQRVSGIVNKAISKTGMELDKTMPLPQRPSRGRGTGRRGKSKPQLQAAG